MYKIFINVFAYLRIVCKPFLTFNLYLKFLNVSKVCIHTGNLVFVAFYFTFQLFIVCLHCLKNQPMLPLNETNSIIRQLLRSIKK